ncbi:MAG: DUF2000 domain-containing protein [Propionibacteriaceae bacterium]|nr:DUF2000 domain-containing protein [Propionibacteriaceae bacterium]
MSTQTTQGITIVVDKDSPSGVSANTCALLAMTLGAEHPEFLGPAVTTSDGVSHAGICRLPIPVLAAPSSTLAQFASDDRLRVVGFTTVAARARTYDSYGAEMTDTSHDSLQYLGIAMVGDRKVIRSLTGDLPLYR